MALFLGEYSTAVDPKHRLAIASDLREQIVPAEDGENWVLVLGPNKRLWLYPDLAYRRMMSQIQRSPLPSRQAGKIGLLFAMARYLKGDTQGRIVLPTTSMERAGIGEEPVVLAGQGDHVEIWPKQAWEDYVKDGLPGYGEMLYDAADLYQPGGQ